MPAHRQICRDTDVGRRSGGYPVLLWMDPLCIFSSPFAMNKATNPISVVLVCLGLGVLVGDTLIFGMLWCVRICPLSGLQDMLYFDAEGAVDPGEGERSVTEVRHCAACVLRRRQAVRCSPWGLVGSEPRDTAEVTRCCVPRRRPGGSLCRTVHSLQQLRARLPDENHSAGYRS